MYFGLRDGLQTGIKWDNVVDIPVKNCVKNAFGKEFLRRSFSSEFRPHSPLHLSRSELGSSRIEPNINFYALPSCDMTN